MFSLVPINDLKQFIDPLTGDMWLAIDVPDVTSPTGFVTRRVNVLQVQPTPVVDTSLATDDQAVDQVGTRVITIGGDLPTDMVLVESLSGNEVMKLKGDQGVTIPSGFLGVGTDSVGLGFGSHKITALSSISSSNSIYGIASGANSTAGYFTTTGSGSGSAYCVRAISSNAAPATVKQGLVVDISGGAVNWGIVLVNGDVKTPSGTGQTETVTFGGGSSGDVASMTFEKGIYISKTLVP